MRKDVTVDRDLSSATPGSPKIGKGDQVYWTINKIDKKKEKLVITSTYWWILPTTIGSLGDDTVNVTPTFTAGTVSFSLPYTVQVDNGSRTDVATGYLVIDTISDPPPPPPKHHQDHDGAVEKQGEDGQGQKGRD